jgi:flagellar hook-associated protein 2
MGVRGLNPGGLDTKKLVEDLMKVERQPIDATKKRKEDIQVEKKEVEKLQTMLSELDSSLGTLKTEREFGVMKADSSNPDILEGVVGQGAMPGTYDFEVRGMSRSEKELAVGFPDVDDTPVGFGFMSIEKENGDAFEVVVEPGATLQEVANQINDSGSGVRAMIINTKEEQDPFRLLVLSEKSGKASKIFVDPDTTFLEFKEQVTGQNLDVLFEDVPITDEDNTLEGLVSGVSFQVKRAEPGTRIQVTIGHDVDKTVEKIKGFVEKYNAVANYVHEQFQVNPETKRGGILSGDGSLRYIMRALQSEIGTAANSGSKYINLSQIGISSDGKTGELKMDETKVRGALADDYEAVTALFAKTRLGSGAADRMSEKLRSFRDSATGVVKSRIRSLDKQIKNQDEQIDRQERGLAQKEDTLKRRFSALEGVMANAQSQGQFLAAKMGGGGGGGG